MKPGKTTLLLVFLFLSCQIIQAQEKFSSVKIYAPADKAKRADLLALLQIDHFQVEGNAIIAEISEEDISKLKTTSFRYDVMVDDVARNLEELNRKYYEDKAKGILPEQNRMAFEQTGKTIGNIIPTPSAFVVQGTLGGYYSFAQMNTAMNNLVASYPSIAQKTSLGTTLAGNNIWCIKISDNVASDEATEPEVLYIGLQHAREAIGGSSMIFFMQYLCENYAANSQVKDLVDNREIYIIPCMNPDGWEYNRTTNPGGGGGWRKNRRVIATGPNQYGVDLNRNWGIDWGNCAGASASCGSGSAVTSNETYWGTSSFSELETQAVRTFVQSHHLVAMIDQHAFGPYYSLPFGRPTLHTGIDSLTPMDQQYYTRIPAMMGNYNGMRSGNSIQSVGYEVAGGVKDWMLKGDIGTGTKGKVFGMTGEGGAGGGTGGSYGSFWPPTSQIINLCKGMVFQNLQLAYAAGSYFDLQDQSDIAVTSLTGSFNFKITRIGIEDKPVTVSLIPLQNIQSVGPPVTVNSLANYYDNYSGNIAYTLPGAMTNGLRIRFAWKIETGGYTYYDTVTKFYNPITMFTDDMEGSNVATNWTVTGGGWNYSTNAAYGGSKSLTESPGGNYAASSTRTAQYTGTFNLVAATAAYLSFWVKHRAENFQDMLQVQVSTDGATWVPIAGTTTIQEAGTLDGSNINGNPSLTGIKDDWTRELFDLNAYLNTAALRLRFRFISDASSSFFYSEDDGFSIDDLKVMKSNTSLITLPVRFINFFAKLTPSKTVELDWQAAVDSKHSHFIVERSTDGQNFISLGRAESEPYKLTDYSPVIGNNYYRIKQYDTDGRFTYSKIIVVNYDPSGFTLMIYPNPGKEDVTFRFNSEKTERVTIRVTDLSGKTVYSKQVTIGGNNNETKINVQGWSSQTYIVKVVKSDNTCLSVQKLIKQ